MSTELTPSMRRSVLIAALRDPSMWPEGFEWNFARCESCGVGLMQRVLHIRRPGDLDTDVFMAGELGLSNTQAYEIFISRGRALKITPAMVADRLEAIHRELELTP